MRPSLNQDAFKPRAGLDKFFPFTVDSEEALAAMKAKGNDAVLGKYNLKLKLLSVLWVAKDVGGHYSVKFQVLESDADVIKVGENRVTWFTRNSDPVLDKIAMQGWATLVATIGALAPDAAMSEFDAVGDELLDASAAEVCEGLEIIVNLTVRAYCSKKTGAKSTQHNWTAISRA